MILAVLKAVLSIVERESGYLKLLRLTMYLLHGAVPEFNGI